MKMKRNYSGDIAIVGMSGLFAGAPDVDSYWNNIVNKVCAVDDPLPEWGGELFLDPQSDELTRIYTQKGGFLKELSRFDARKYGIMPNSMVGSEPDQYHALDLAAQALADAGLKEGDFDGESTGIILGHGIHAHRANVNGIQHGIVIDQTLRLMQGLFPHAGPEAMAQIKTLLKAQLPIVDVDSSPGLVPNVMTGRIANRLNLMGPNYIIDAACASSLIAVESAMLELQRGRADVMLAGGINTSTSPLVYAVFCALGALSRNSAVRPFDSRADGTLLGEGAGVVVLKRLEDALDQGDRVYAVIKSVGQSSDGRAKGVMAPRMEGEALAISRAYRQSGIDPNTIGLLEAHGTGIPLGDQTEIGALRSVWGERQRRMPHIALGSVKSMIGHCIPAAGMASMIKMSNALHHKILPPTLCDEVSGGLGIEDTPFYINNEARPWIHGGDAPRRAGINAFGFGGVNSHALLEEAPQTEGEDVLATFLPRRIASAPALLLFAAAERADLITMLEAFAAELVEGADLHALAADCWSGIGEGEQRLAIIATDVADLTKKLELALKKLADGDKHRIQARGGVYFSDQPLGGKTAFLFPGENSQYTGMLARLAMHFPALRRWFDFLDGLFVAERDIAPGEALFPPPTVISDEQRDELKTRLMDMELGSEAAFTSDQGLFALLGALGIKAEVVLGHSTGENAALIASGIPRMDGAAVGDYIRRMNELYRELNASGAIPEGVLLSVGAIDFEQVNALVEADDELYLAMDNCDNQSILFGSEEAVEKAASALKAEGGICLRLPLARGYHTPQLAPMAEAFSRLFEGIELGHSEVQLYSCVKAEPFPDAGQTEAFRATAADQYMSRVRFRESIRRLYEDGVRTFVEVGPSSTLSGFVRDILKKDEHLAVSVNDRNRDDLEQLYHLLGRLFANGNSLQLDGLYGEGAQEPARQPPYLPTSLPMMELDGEGLAQLRQLLGGDAAFNAAASSAATAHSGGEGRTENLASHFELMNEFLQQQERMMASWLAARGTKSDDKKD